MLFVTLAWGLCFLAIRWGLRDATPLWFAALRALLAGAILLSWAVITGRPMVRGRRAWLLVSVLGLTNVSVAFAAMFAGTAAAATGVAAVVANSQALLVPLPALWLYRERLPAAGWPGLALGFAGLFLLAAPGGGQASGVLLSLLAAAAITTGTLLSRQLDGLDLVSASGWHLLVGAVPLVVAASAVEGAPRIVWSVRFTGSLLFLAVVGTALAFLVWFGESRRAPLAALASWTLLVPVFAVAAGVFVLGERPTARTGLGIALVAGALAVLTLPARAKSRPAGLSHGLPPDHR